MPPDTPPPTSSTDLRLIEDAPPAQAAATDVANAAESVRVEMLQAERDKLQLINDDLRQNTEQRKKYARHLFKVMVGWLAFVAFVTVEQGFRGIYHLGYFQVSDGVLIALITTTTATVLGVFLVVANYLFPKS